MRMLATMENFIPDSKENELIPFSSLQLFILKQIITLLVRVEYGSVVKVNVPAKQRQIRDREPLKLHIIPPVRARLYINDH